MKKKTSDYPKSISNRYGKVKIYRNVVNGKWMLYVVTWSVGRVRNRKAFSDEAAAENHADLVLKQFENGQPLAAQMTTSDALYLEACRKRMNGVPIMTAIEYYLAVHGDAGADGIPPAKARDQFLKDLETRGNSPRDIGSVKTHLKEFCDSFSVPMTAVKPGDIDGFLQRKKCSNRTRQNIRVTLCRFWRWAKKKGILPKLLDSAAENSATYKVERSGSPGIFTPEELAKLLGAAEDRWLPYLTICAFAGVRQAEVLRLSWEDINLDEKVIILGANVTKTNKRRVAHMPDNLVAWLRSAQVEKSGPVCPCTRPNVETKRAADAAGVRWVDNGLRHSYISYQMALLRDAAKVAEQCGNSEAQVQASYKANALEHGAVKWFGITPE